MQSNDDSLAAIPKDKLVLKLLQELSTRIERLERQNASILSTELESSSHFSKDWKESTQSFPSDLNDDERSPSDGTAEPGPRHYLPGWVPPGRVLVPYGYLLDGERITNNMKLPRDRLEDSDITPEIQATLKYLGGIPHVPADFRIRLTNFWLPIPEQQSVLDTAVTFCDALKTSNGVFWVKDFDLKGRQMRYGQSRAFNHTLEIPPYEMPVRENQQPKRSRDQPSPWRRLI